MIHLNAIPQSMGIECEVLVKCEFFNAGGSVKDRIGRRMVEEAERTGRIKPGDTLIEPTSGNTGIGLALAAAIKGYRMIITLPEKMSEEKVNVLKALGAEIVRTPTEAAYDSPDSHIGVAKRLNKEIPNSHILDQYANPNNPLAHYDGTAAEILEQCDNKLDMCVMTAGTGGTICGIARRLREALPNVQIVGVDPVGSILAVPEELNGPGSTYAVEGIGYDFIPIVLDRDTKLIDKWIKSTDKPSFEMSRRLIAEEGLLCGGSSGSAVYCALEACKSLKKGQRCVVVLPYSVRNYMSKFLTDDWMLKQGFIDTPEFTAPKDWWQNKTVKDLTLNPPCTVSHNVKCSDAIKILEAEGFDQLPVIGDNGEVLGVLTEAVLMGKLINKRISGDTPVSEALYKQFLQVPLNMTLADLSVRFNKEHFVLVVAKQMRYRQNGVQEENTVICGVVSRIDLLRFIASGSASRAKLGTLSTDMDQPTPQRSERGPHASN